jgi:hypothetical protein
VVHIERLNLKAHGPVRVAVDAQGRFYITDPQMARLIIADALGQAKVTIPLSIYPAGIAIGPDGRIYLGDVITQAVYVWDAQGNYLYALGAGEGEFSWPNDIAVDEITGRVYVVDSPAHQVKVYTLEGIYLFTIYGPDTSPLNDPTGIAVDSAGGRVIVSDHNNKRLQVFDVDGNWISNIGSFTRPQGLAVDDQGNIFVADSFQGMVYIYNSEGASLGDFGQFGKDPGELRIPTDVALDPYGRLAVVSYNNGAVEIFGPEGYIQPPDQVEPPAISSLSFTTLVEASVEFSPETLNLSSRGRWFRAYIEPVDGSAGDIQLSSVLLNDQVPAEAHGWELEDSDDDGLLELMVRFDREQVAGLIDPAAEEAELTITAIESGNTIYEGSGTIKVVAPHNGVNTPVKPKRKDDES